MTEVELSRHSSDFLQSTRKLDLVGKHRRPIDRLPVPVVPVYRLAEQQYCELKVDLELDHPEVEERLRELPQAAKQVEALDRGKKFHEAAAGEAVPISQAEYREARRRAEPLTLVESIFMARYGEISLMGRPDLVQFDGKGTAWVVEYKVRERPYLFPSDDAQLRAYGYLLERAERPRAIYLVGLFVGPAALARIANLREDQLARFARRTCQKPEARKVWSDCSLPGLGKASARSVTFTYDPHKARDELKFFTEYWLGKRKPIPTTKPAKCAACRVNAVGLCPVALAPYRDPVVVRP